MSLAGRLLNIFATPSDVFDDIKSRPSATSNWLMPAVLLILVSWLSAGLIFSQPSIRQQLSDLTGKAIDRQIEKGRLTSAQAEQAREAAEKWGSVSYKVGSVVFPVFVAFAVPFWWGLILWLGGAKVMKGDLPYLKAVEMAGLSNMILVLDAVVRSLLILLTGNLFASPSLALAIKDFDPQNPVHSLLGLVNIMIFWILLVRSISLRRVTGVSLGKAAAWVFGVWAAYTGALIGIGIVARAASGG
jgi:hypothetical protein